MIAINQQDFHKVTINKVYKALIVPKVKEALEDWEKNKLKYTNHTEQHIRDAYDIVSAFLLKHHLNTADPATLEQNIMSYLMGGNTASLETLQRIIVSFWACAAEVLIRRIHAPNTPPCLSEQEAAALSKWQRIKEDVLNLRDPGERRQTLLSVITENTCCLFSNARLSDIADWASGGGDVSDDRIRDIDFSPELSKAIYGEPKANQKANQGSNQNTGRKADSKKGPQCALDMLEIIFDYSKMSRELANGSPRHQLLSAMNVPVCPYCNRQYITLYSEKIIKKGKKQDQEATIQKTTADLDHFYIKSQYPFLALSLYNFIPSCQICNSRFKGATDFYLYPHVYPYTEDFSDAATFRLDLAADSMDYDADLNGKIKLPVAAGHEAVKNSISTFMLEEVYQSHANYVQELLLKSKAYSPEQIAALKDEFGSLLGSAYSIRDLIYGRYLNKDEYYQRPLAKLTKDILDLCYPDDPIEWN